MIRTAAGGMMMLAVIVGIRPLQDAAQRLGEDDQHDAAYEPEPRAETERAVEAEMRVMRDDEVRQHSRREDRSTKTIQSRLIVLSRVSQ